LTSGGTAQCHGPLEDDTCCSPGAKGCCSPGSAASESPCANPGEAPVGPDEAGSPSEAALVGPGRGNPGGGGGLGGGGGSRPPGVRGPAPAVGPAGPGPAPAPGAEVDAAPARGGKPGGGPPGGRRGVAPWLAGGTQTVSCEGNSSKNSRLVGAEGVGASAKGKDDSSKTTWREMRMRFVVTSMHR
jgi:hypothetical protein